jgi:hypothetical protein
VTGVAKVEAMVRTALVADESSYVSGATLEVTEAR